MSNQIIIPNIMQIGAGASLELGNIMNRMEYKNPLIITDSMMVELGYISKIEENLKNNNIISDVFKDTIPEPTVKSIQEGVNKVKNGNFDSLIALGGGSPIDSAKAISILGKFGGEMKEYKFPRLVDEIGIPIIAIPTTAGTGTEVTKFTIIADEKTDEKMLCVGKGFMPSVALIDYELTLSLPQRSTADTGIDALTHAMEAYVSKKANAFSDAQALQAMSLIAPNLRTVFHNGNDKEAREKMMLGATLAGVAFSNASVALVHGMSRPIGAFYHVPHGLSNAMLLPSVTEFSIPAATQRYAQCARAMGVAEKEDSDEEANNKLLKELENLNKELNVPSPEEFGINREEFMDNLEIMAEQALASGSPGNNPRVPDNKEIINIYKLLWS
ncbi:MAG: alcohol dehydrogenase [Pelagibacterales bacterium]|nr:alcohol dehydrogenase [Pelagibacterales bacterium]PPR16888.1 MAG: Lactaldehyde reductase [Alphaproteobacteria bacterium MarineAlpha9_Bin3]